MVTAVVFNVLDGRHGVLGERERKKKEGCVTERPTLKPQKLDLEWHDY